MTNRCGNCGIIMNPGLFTYNDRAERIHWGCAEREGQIMETNLTVKYGNVTFQSQNRLTLDDVSNLAAAAKIAGIPPTAEITQMNFRYGYGHEGIGSEIQLSWKVD